MGTQLDNFLMESITAATAILGAVNATVPVVIQINDRRKNHINYNLLMMKYVIFLNH